MLPPWAHTVAIFGGALAGALVTLCVLYWALDPIMRLLP